MGLSLKEALAYYWQHITAKLDERLTIDPEVTEEGAANLINADSLGGVLASEYALKEEVDAAIPLVDTTLSMSAAAADAAAVGAALNEKVSKAGDTMTGLLNITKANSTPLRLQSGNEANSGATKVQFHNGEGTFQGGIFIDYATHKMSFISNKGRNEYYNLPAPSTDQGTATVGYDILTTKGSYTMSGWLTASRIIVKSGDGYPAFAHQDANGNFITFIHTNESNHRMYFVQKATDTSYVENYFLPALSTGLTADATYNILTTKSPVTVAQGGTGATTFASGEALIGNGTGAFQTRAILNNTAINALGWSNTVGTKLLTVNTLAYWNGAYSGTSSNISVVGTITKGVWNGSAIPVAHGGTGATDVQNARVNLLFSNMTTTTAPTNALIQGVSVFETPSTAVGTGDPTGGVALTVARGPSRGMQIANGYSANSLKWRFIHGNQTSDAGITGYSPWYTIYHSGNISTLMTEITNRLSNANGVSF